MITLVGNCQLHRLQYVMGVNGFDDREYVPTSDEIGVPFDAERALSRVAAGGVVVAQPIINPEHPLNYKALLTLNDNILFVPYIYIDGIFSLSSNGPLGSFVQGQERVLPLLAQDGRVAVSRAFHDGTLDFANAERLNESLDELARREAECCHVRVAEFIRATYQAERPITTHNHPSSALFDHFCQQVFQALAIPYRPMSKTHHAARAVYAFSQTPRLFSPYDVDALGLRYPHDEQWFENGRAIIESLAPLVQS